MEEEVSKLLVVGFIRRVDDVDWVSLVVIVPKKNGKWRVCVDFRPLNAATKRHHYPMPFQDEILDEVAGHERYSICDGFCGYFQIEIAPEDQKLTSFITPWGVFCYTRMPFGLVNAYATFQGWMDRLLSPFFGKFARSFMDDIGIYSDRKSHVQKVDQIFAKIDGDGGQLNPNKCKIAHSKIILLGHEVSANGIAPDPSKVESLLLMDAPTSTKQLLSFVQKVRYLSRSFQMLVEYIQPLQRASMRDPFVWGKVEQNAFEEVKDRLSTLPILMPPNWDQPFYVSLSVGVEAVGAVLMQKGIKQSYMRPIYYISRKMSMVEKAWTQEEKLVWALVFSLQKWKSYLLGRITIVLTSCVLLPHMLRFPGDSPRMKRWIMIIQDFEVSFIKEETTRSKMADLLTYKELVPTKNVKEIDAHVEPSNEAEVILEKVEGVLYFDGAFKQKTKIAGIGYAFVNRESNELWSGSDRIEANSHNEAEYLSLIHALQACLQKGIRSLMVKGDSLLIIRQVQGVWKVQKDSLRPLLQQVMQLQDQFVECQFRHIPRDKNARAHELASRIVAQEVGVHVVNMSFYKGRESLEEEECVFKDGKGEKRAPIS